MKTCKGCQEEKDDTDFSGRPNGKLRSRCKKCEAAYTNEWRRKNPEHEARLDQVHRERRRKRYAEDEAYRADVRARNAANWSSLPLAEKRKRGWRNHLRTAYGISPQEYEALLLAQDGRCGCCRKKAETSRSLVVDHGHGTGGKIRGLLCYSCNSGIGLLGDTEEGVQRALDYLRSRG